MSDFTFEKLNDRQVRALADAHVNRYENLLRKSKEGAKGIRPDECKTLLGIWKSITVKLEQGNWRLRLTKSEVNEIVDACVSGDYDQTLRVTRDPPS
jgi:hypothetical protein